MTGPGELVLIRTKLAPQRIGNAPVSRDALIRQLDDGRGRKLTLVIGPAGCGKTMLVTQWRQKLLMQGAKVAWYNAGVDDSDGHAAGYIVEALLQAGVSIDKEALHVYLRSGARAWQPLVASLVDDLSNQEAEIYLVIDDMHHIASFGTYKLLDRWLSMAPARVHLVLVTRTRPPLNTARLRAEDELTELQFAELRFSQEETHRFLQGQRLQNLTAAQEHALYEMTDGWAAGLQLLAFALRKESDPAHFFERQDSLSLSGAEALEQYLETAVVEHLSESELGFLVRISACRRFNRELCEQITGNPEAGKFLKRFESENLFLLPIETNDTEPWYRFHRLFSGFLNQRLQRLSDAERQRIHNISSRWFAARELHVEAMRHALLGDDHDFAVELIDRAARRAINGAMFLELLQWCEAVPYESLRQRLNVLMCMAWAQMACSRMDDFDRSMAAIEQHPARQRPEMAFEVQLLRASGLRRRDDTAACLALVEPLLSEQPVAQGFQSFMLLQIASMSLIYTNDFERARDVARLRHQIGIRGRPDDTRPLSDVVTGLSYLVQGQIQLATEALTEFVEQALQRAAQGMDAAGLYAGHLIEALYQSGSLSQAQDILDRYLELVDAVGNSDSLLHAYGARARLQALGGDVKAARTTLTQLEEIGHHRRLDRLVAWSLQQQVSLAVERAQPAAIADLLSRLDRLAHRYRDAKACAWSEIGLAARLAHAHVAFDRDGVDGMAEIEAAETEAASHRRQLLCVRLGLMRCILRFREGRRDEALAEARRLLTGAADAGMRRVLPDLGSAVLPLVQQLLGTTISDSLRGLLLDAQGELQPGAAARSGAPAPEPRESTTAEFPVAALSGRESEILGLLAQGLSLKTIARMTNITPGTVKWHVRNVYGKLNALSRDDALTKARKLRILA